MRLYNTLTRKIEDFKPLEDKKVRVYSCGPTVYDRIHIGNLYSFITADTLRRVLTASGYDVVHVMNYTDVDDKTIQRSRKRFPKSSPEEALRRLTDGYKEVFLADMQAIGNDTKSLQFVSAVDSIAQMQQLISQLYEEGFAYIADDGVYFSIEKYLASGKKYGQLTEITASRTSNARISNDEYDKDNAHDFALWKTRKNSEPAWPFDLGGRELAGRPGWHIECSAMSVTKLGQPFDIHTGGVDLIFPHHENEIAQSTAGKDGPFYARYFVHNEHLLVDNKKMSKSLGNFKTLQDLAEDDFDPIAFRLLALSTHYQKQVNYSSKNFLQAQYKLEILQALADQRFQVIEYSKDLHNDFLEILGKATASYNEALQDNLNTPLAIQAVLSFARHIRDVGVPASGSKEFVQFLHLIDSTLGLKLSEITHDISANQKHLLTERDELRNSGNFQEADRLRDELGDQGIALDDTHQGTRWYRKRVWS